MGDKPLQVVTADPADTGIVARCIGCGCDDLHACWDEATGNPCSWVRLDVHAGRGVCSACPELVEDWDAGDREVRVPIELAAETADCPGGELGQLVIKVICTGKPCVLSTRDRLTFHQHFANSMHALVTENRSKQRLAEAHSRYKVLWEPSGLPRVRGCMSNI